MTEPSTLNELPTFSDESDEILDEEGNIRVEYGMDDFIHKTDVQRLVCRRIIFLATPNVEEDKVIIRDYKYLFNITDAMIEEERKRCKN